MSVTEANVFFFQAEDGIRDKLVTGVQTCALPIFRAVAIRDGECGGQRRVDGAGDVRESGEAPRLSFRSEERRVGKECRSRRWLHLEKSYRACAHRREGRRHRVWRW